MCFINVAGARQTHRIRIIMIESHFDQLWQVQIGYCYIVPIRTVNILALCYRYTFHIIDRSLVDYQHKGGLRIAGEMKRLRAHISPS